jgi:amino acid adenylation domain-containing protein
MQDLTGQGFRLSSQQKELWSLQGAGKQSFYAVCAISIEGDLKLVELEEAVRNIVKRHEILRTTFLRPAGIKTAFQVVGGEAQFLCEPLDLSNLLPEKQEAEIETRIVEETKKPFDLERGPVLRVVLIKLGEQRHALIVSLPAICADSVTLSNFVGELATAYDSTGNGQKAEADPMQYADFAEWQNELLAAQEESGQAGRDFWLQVGAASFPTLPLEKRAAEAPTFSEDSLSVALDFGAWAKIESAARDKRASPASVLFACWQILIWRLTGKSNFNIFNLCDGRQIEDLKQALGPYAKYLPINCHCQHVSFDTLVKATHHAISEVAEWQEYFEPVTDWHSTNNAVAFEFEERPSNFETGRLSFSILKQNVCFQPFKLKLSFARAGEVLTATLRYNSQLFSRETIERFAGYFQKILKTLVLDVPQPNQPGKPEPQIEVDTADLRSIEILSDTERESLLVELNRTETDYESDKCIQQLFEAQVERTPDANALVFGDRELTYHDLNVGANQLAHHLRKLGVAPNDRVGLCVARGAEMIVSMLGILKAGGAYVPLNPAHPAERLAIQLAESKASILITDGDSGGSFCFAGETVDLDRDQEMLKAQAETNPSLVTTPNNLIYVIYTSGSTGIPKGVAVQQRNLVNYTQFILRRLQVDGPLRFATVSTITADLGNTCIFPSLVSGGCLHVISYDVSMEGELFRDYVAKSAIDVLKIVPSHLNALLASQPEGILPARYLIFGGEALSWELVERVSRTGHTCKIVNHYGPTETTVGSLTFSVDGHDRSPYSMTVPIGRPIANTRVYILDDRLQPTPMGAAGELYIGGAGVAAGYLNQTAETAARFIADPFASEPGARLYRTGDLARCLPDGNVEFLGRLDTQVKVRGFRVELGEIETLLAQHPSVRQAVVTTWRQASEDVPSTVERLTAYLVTSGGRPPSQEELRGFLQQRLPDYMVPSAFVLLKSLPLTPNGKVDRSALPAPDEARPELQRTFVEPRTPVEKELAHIWEELLRVNEVSVHDNFFDLGGHSLLATQVVSRMRKRFQMEIPLRSLFELPTIGALAEKIQQENENEAARMLSELENLSDEEAERLLEVEKERQFQ